MTIEQRASSRLHYTRWCASAILLASMALFALPQFRIMLSDRTFTPDGLDLILSAILYNGQLVSYPLTLRLAAAGVVLLLAGSGVLTWLQKRTFAAGTALLATVLTLVVRLLVSDIDRGLTAAGAGKLAIQPTPAFAFVLLLPFAAAVVLLAGQGSERLARAVFQASAFVSVASVAMITLYMIIAGLPAISKIGPLQFLFGTVWQPTHATNPQFGILPMMLTTIAATFGAILLGVPIGLLTAVFLAEVAPRQVTAAVRPAIELLAGIPSVIYGFFGLQLLVPAVQKLFHLPTGATLFSAIIILAIMILPTLVSTAETGLRAVPGVYREASLAVGASRVATIFKVTLPAARSAILSGVILGVGRAIGETMAVIMVAGNVPRMPALFNSVRPLTVGIALEMSYASGLHQQALFAIGLVLFLFIMAVNLSFGWLSRRGVQADAR
jgi:phosphate ABC transporter permease protein PstC